MPEILKSYDRCFERFIERFHYIWDWCECDVMRHMNAVDQDTQDDKPHPAVTNEISLTARRIQEGFESLFAEWRKDRAFRKDPTGAVADAARLESDKALREACKRDVARFAREFFHEYCRLKPSVFHRWMFREYNRRAGLIPPKREGRRLAVAAPRGHAKSTLQSLIFPIHSLLYGRERYIMLLSATLKQSRQKLDAIAHQLKTNQALRRVFAEVESPKNTFTSTVIEALDTRIEAFSAGSEFRGVMYNGFRPTHVILDDVEDSESVESGEQREKLADWFNEVIEHIGNGYTNYTIIGTLLHP